MMGLGDINGFPNNKNRLLMLENLNITKVNLNDKDQLEFGVVVKCRGQRHLCNQLVCI